MATPMVFRHHDITYRVKRKRASQKKFDSDIAYIVSPYNDYVYLFRGNLYSNEKSISEYSRIMPPGIYMYDDHSILIDPRTDEDKEAFSVRNIIYLTPDSIFSNLGDEIAMPESEILDESDIFKPAIKETDDIALAGMKYMIGAKKINFNAYANKFPDSATKNNGRRALTHGDTLKMSMLSRFADVFDINAGIILWDKKGCPNPVDPEYRTVFTIFDSEPIDLSDPNLRFKECVKREEDNTFEVEDIE